MTDRKQHEFFAFYYIQDCEWGSTNEVVIVLKQEWDALVLIAFYCTVLYPLYVVISYSQIYDVTMLLCKHD